ncbi:MAG: binding-protein-dependent transport system inner rane component [Polaromonas sp.]|nr:binding-protein-dependent transport system inner rane component [Polaromonas sp.]
MNADSLVRADGGRGRCNPVLLALPLLAALALYGLPFLKTAPNRLVSGEPLYFSALLQGPASLLALSLVALFVMAFLRPVPAVLWAAVALPCLLVPGLLWLAAGQAAALAPGHAPIARTSLGSGFWVATAAAGLLASDGMRRLNIDRTGRWLLPGAATLAVVLMVSTGWCSELAILKEYASRADVFWGMVLRHLEIVGLSLAGALVLGLPLGWAARRRARVGRSLFPVLNLIQTVPSIALFGLLMAPLALLATNWPLLGRAGVSGVGLVPGVIALVLYSLLPVVRGTVTGLAQVPRSVVEAASGLGMGPASIFWQVEAPLALPVVLAGLRTAAVQAVGLAAVTALIGAGGLGAIMFEGLYANAQDLVLLGVLPIVFVGVLVDAAFGGLTRAAARRLTGRPA